MRYEHVKKLNEAYKLANVLTHVESREWKTENMESRASEKIYKQKKTYEQTIHKCICRTLNK